MTVEVVASAPGKVVLSGEYAVLDGAPAIAMAVNRRAQATVSRSNEQAIRILAPGYTNVEGQASLQRGQLQWQQGKSEFSLVAAVCEELRSHLQGNEQISLDTDRFSDARTRKKVGIGSSAALTVALSAALRRSENVAAIARRAHSHWQGGMGSGVDIACSAQGGLLEYRVAEYETTALQWPAGLVFQLVWTGVEASTKARLAGLARCRRKTTRDQLVAAASEMATLWRSGLATDIVAGYQHYNEQLQAFSADHDLGIFDGGHRELLAVAAERGLTYKPCGAGGGDVGIVLGTDAEALSGFVAEQSHHCELLDCSIDSRGVTITGGLTGNE